MEEAYAIGIDIGGTNTKVGLASVTAMLVQHETIPSDLQGTDASPFLAAVYQRVERYIRACPVRGIGIALCSLVNADHSGAFLSVNAPALNHLNIRQAFEQRFGLPVQVLNDVNAYALAEYHLGAGKGTRRLLCLGLGTGIAIAALVDGQLIETWGGVAADAARIILDPQSSVACNAGVRGSAEALCGSAHILRLARQRYGHAEVTVRDVIVAAQQGNDPIAAAIMAEVGGYVGHLSALLSPIFFPQKIVITGGTSEAGAPLLDAIRARYASLIGDYMTELARLETGVAQPVEICKGALGPEAAMLGAALGFLHRGDR